MDLAFSGGALSSSEVNFASSGETLNSSSTDSSGDRFFRAIRLLLLMRNYHLKVRRSLLLMDIDSSGEVIAFLNEDLASSGESVTTSNEEFSSSGEVLAFSKEKFASSGEAPTFSNEGFTT
jgi:hypothetical protein